MFKKSLLFNAIDIKQAHVTKQYRQFVPDNLNVIASLFGKKLHFNGLGP